MDETGFDGWQAALEHTPLIAAYHAEDKGRLRALARRFLREKHIEPAHGLRLVPGMAELIAYLACVPILELGLEWYRGWRSVILYAGDFVAHHEVMDEAGVVHASARALSGEAWPAGPVVLSWGRIEAELAGGVDGSLVVHELAHKLDLLNGRANGFPPLHRELSHRRWTEVWQSAYDDLVRRVEHHRPLPIDGAGADDPAEFFACASEEFFLAPDELSGWRSELYGQLAAWYRQDPLALLTG